MKPAAISFFLLLCSSALFADQGDVIRKQIAALKVPTMVLLGSRSENKQWQKEWSSLLDNEELADIGLACLPVEDDSESGRAAGTVFRKNIDLGAHSADRRLWVLVAPEGQLLGVGERFPRPHEVLRIIENKGFVSGVGRLKQFLQMYPEHMEARVDLLMLLKRVIWVKMNLNGRLTQNELSPFEDRLIWGTFVDNLNFMIQNDERNLLNISFDNIIYSKYLEKNSPIMKLFYRSVRPRVMASVQRYPEHPTGWTNLIRISRVANLPFIASDTSELRFFNSPLKKYPRLPFLGISQAVFEDANYSKEWSGAVNIIYALWKNQIKDKLTYFDRGWIRSGNKYRDPGVLLEESRNERLEVWEKVLSPLIEAMVLSNQEILAQELLSELDDSWVNLDLERRLIALVAKLNRSDLWQQWAGIVRSMPSKMPREGMLNGEIHLFFYDQPMRNEINVDLYKKQFGRAKIILEVTPASSIWVDRLSWKGKGPKWSLLDGNAKILLQGDILPDPVALASEYSDLGLKSLLSSVERYIQGNGDQVKPMVLKAEILGACTQFFLDGGRGTQSPIRDGISKIPLNAEERAVIFEYLKAIEQVNEKNAYRFPELVRSSLAYIPQKSALGAEYDVLNIGQLALSIINNIEKDILKWPNDNDLWEAWLILAKHVGRSPEKLLLEIKNSPTSNNPNCPSISLLRQVAYELRKHERWRSIVEILHSRMTAKITEMNSSRGAGSANYKDTFINQWDIELSKILLEAYVKLGQVRDAELLIDAHKQVDIKLATLEAGTNSR